MQLKALLLIAVMALTTTANITPTDTDSATGPWEDRTIQGQCNTSLRLCFERAKNWRDGKTCKKRFKICMVFGKSRPWQSPYETGPEETDVPVSEPEGVEVEEDLGEKIRKRWGGHRGARRGWF